MLGTLVNERQETMFNTDLSEAIDQLVSLTREKDKIKAALEVAEKEAVKAMRNHRVTMIRFEGGSVELAYKEEQYKAKVNVG